MDKEFYDKYSKDLECSCCQDLEHCIKGKEPLKINCAIHFFKDKIAELETKLAESEKKREELDFSFEMETTHNKEETEKFCREIKTLKQQLAEKEKEKQDWIRAFEELAMDSIDHESFNATVDEYEKEIEELKIYQNQTAIAELEKVKKEIKSMPLDNTGHDNYDFEKSTINYCLTKIDQQIKELKGETKDD